MAWTTSAHPWASELAAGALTRVSALIDGLRPPQSTIRPATLAKTLGVAHLLVIAVVVDLATIHILLLISGAALLTVLLALPSLTAQSPPPCERTDMEAEPATPPRQPLVHSGNLEPVSRAELMARISHELRTPLNAIIGFSDLMGGELYGPMGHPRYREYVDHIRSSGRDLLRSAEDTLAITDLLARPQTGEIRQSIELRPLITEAWQLALLRQGAFVPALRMCDVDDVEIVADRRGLRQTITNLLAEATARTLEHGTVSVATEVQDGVVRLVIRAPNSSDHIEPRSTSLPACLARTMMELQGASLIETLEHGAWTATICLDQAVQAELFGG